MISESNPAEGRCMKRLVAALCGLSAGWGVIGCGEWSSEPRASQPQEPTPQTFLAFTERWFELQADSLRINSKALAELYRQQKEDPPIDPRTGKPREVNPLSIIHTYSNLGYRFPMMSPAFNTFQPHVLGAKSGLIQTIDPEAARLRIWIEDSKRSVVWQFFALEQLARPNPRPNFVDAPDGVPSEIKPGEFVAVAKKALSGSQATLASESDTAIWVARRMDYFDKSCLACHPKVKLGEPAGWMIYAMGKSPRKEP